MGLIWYFNCI